MKRKNLKRGKKYIKKIRMTADFLLETIRMREQWSNIFTLLKETSLAEYKSDFENYSNNIKLRTI